MNSVFSQASLLATLLAVMSIGPITAIGVLRLRKKRMRTEKRSPINGQLLREPGHSLRLQIDDLRGDLEAGVLLASMLPVLLMALALGQAHINGVDSILRFLPLYVLVPIVAVGYVIWKLWKDAQRLDRLRTGLDGEIAVGQELNRLMLQGAIVFHDVPGESFNIDHVVVCTSGVFAVETKGYTKTNGKGGSDEATVEYDGKILRFPRWVSYKPLEQASRQASWLSKWLTNAVGSPVRAQPIVALPGWFVRRTGRGEVWVYSGKELVGLPKVRSARSLLEQDVQRISHQLEQRCRTVMPGLVEAKV